MKDWAKDGKGQSGRATARGRESDAWIRLCGMQKNSKNVGMATCCAREIASTQTENRLATATRCARNLVCENRAV